MLIPIVYFILLSIYSTASIDTITQEHYTIQGRVDLLPFHNYIVLNKTLDEITNQNFTIHMEITSYTRNDHASLYGNAERYFTVYPTKRILNTLDVYIILDITTRKFGYQSSLDKTRKYRRDYALQMLNKRAGGSLLERLPVFLHSLRNENDYHKSTQQQQRQQRQQQQSNNINKNPRTKEDTILFFMFTVFWLLIITCLCGLTNTGGYNEG